MTLDELTPFERFQLEKYGNIICTTEPGPVPQFESGQEDAERFTEWASKEHERQMDQHAGYFESDY